MPAIHRFAIPAAMLAFGLAMSASTHAELRSTTSYQNPAGHCQLSIPTTDTQVRPKATGFRNESTTKGAFVICGFDAPTADATIGNVYLTFHTLDGVSRAISCTAVTGVEGVFPLVYSTKAFSTPYVNGNASLGWTDYDFAEYGTPYYPDIRNAYSMSVTCNLPPQTSIIWANTKVTMDIGN